MQISAKELSTILNGTLEGNPDVLVSKPSKIEEGTEGTITFLGNPKYESFAYTTRASILLVSKDFVPAKPIQATLIRVDDVYASIAFLLDQFGKQTQQNSGISDKAHIHSTASVGNNTSIGAFSVVEELAVIGSDCQIYPQVYIGKNVRIGNHVTLYPGVKIYHECTIGDHCILHANVVIGSDGFGFAPTEDGSYKKIAQIGNVAIESNVEIGANTVIDRATMGSTHIRSGVKLDNLIQIAHNVEIGNNTVIAAQTGIAGSTRIGKNGMIGGQVGFAGHLQIADGVKIQAQTGVGTNIKKPNTALYGSPALGYHEYLRAYAIFKNLPALAKQVRDLENQLEQLQKNQLNSSSDL